MRGRWVGAVVVTALLVLVTACARPVGTLLRPSALPSISPVAQHAPLTITDAAFHAGEVGVTYAPVTLAANGGVAPYRWAIAFGALPGGLTFGADGTVSGTPTAPGTFAFGIQLFDSASDTAGVPHAIDIVSRLTAALVPACVTECDVELGCVSVCGTFGQVSGGLQPLSYSRSGVLPAGTTLTGLTLDGTFTGLPGRLQFTVQITDGLGVTASISPTFNMLPHVSLASGVCYGNYPTGCSAQLGITGGGGAMSVQLAGLAQNLTANPPPYAGRCWTPAATTPPAGYGLSVGGGYVNVTIPKNDIAGYGAVWTLVVTDHQLCGAGVYCSSAPATVRIGVQCG